MTLNGGLDALIQARKPGYSLEQAFYKNEDIYRVEMDKILMRNWIFVGHESQWPKPGDFELFELDSESVIIIRGREGALHAFLSVCRHRGSHICLQAKGSVKRLTCPYHAWSYSIDGDLISARLMADDFDKSKFGLHQIHIESLGGLVFVCFADHPPSLNGAQRDLADVFDMFGMENLKLAAKRQYLIEANWKLTVENYQECYHCAPSHPEYAAQHTLKVPPAEYDQYQTHMLEKLEVCGLKNIEFDYHDDLARPGESGYHYGRYALFEGIKTGSKTGEPVAPLLGQLKDYDSGASDLMVGPFSYFLIYSDHMVGYRFLPINKDQSYCDVFWYVRGDAVEGQDYNVDDVTWLWHVTTLADEEIIVNNQKGVNSRYYQPGPFSEMEDMTDRFVRWYLDQMSA